MKTKSNVRERQIQFEFVEFMPDELGEDVLYISLKYATAKHKCFCGCGTEVVTPISPVGWQVIFDGETVSLHPSIGNWNFPCRAHYWIRRSIVVPARSMNRWEIEEGRANDREERDAFFDGRLQSESAPCDGDDDDNGKIWIFGSHLSKRNKGEDR
jgi:hypothetical protein